MANGDQSEQVHEGSTASDRKVVPAHSRCHQICAFDCDRGEWTAQRRSAVVSEQYAGTEMLLNSSSSLGVAEGRRAGYPDRPCKAMVQLQSWRLTGSSLARVRSKEVMKRMVLVQTADCYKDRTSHCVRQMNIPNAKLRMLRKAQRGGCWAVTRKGKSSRSARCGKAKPRGCATG